MLYLCLLYHSGSSQEFREKRLFLTGCHLHRLVVVFSCIWFGTWTDRAVGMNAEKREVVLLGLTLEVRWSSLGSDSIASLPNLEGIGPLLGLHATV